MIPDLLFLMFSTVLLVAALGVIAARNPMYCVLFMVLAFFNAAGIFILLGAEFLGLLMVMVYVGAIAVMFLFVLMTVDIDFDTLKEGVTSYGPVGVLVAGVLLLEILAAVWGGLFDCSCGEGAMPVPADVDNITALGMILFTNYAAPFLLASIILLVAMVGAIVLTHRQRGGVKRQNIGKQLSHNRASSLVMAQPKTGQGVSATHWKPNKVDK